MGKAHMSLAPLIDRVGVGNAAHDAPSLMGLHPLCQAQCEQRLMVLGIPEDLSAGGRDKPDSKSDL